MGTRPDIVDIDGIRSDSTRPTPPTSLRPFLSIWYRCCNTYGRLYRNQTECAYEGRCPGCGRQAHVGIGPNGTSTRVFKAC